MQQQSLPQRFVRKLAYRESRLRTFLRALNLNLWPDDRRIRTYKDAHKGRRAFILGNGPSLKIADLNRLTNEITFASNKIFLSFTDTTWRPTYYVLCDLLVAAQNGLVVSGLAGTKFLTNYSRGFIKGSKSAIWFNELGENYPLNFLADYEAADPEQVRFSTDASCGLDGGGTVIYNQLQLAYYMGITEVILIGLDFSFNTAGNTPTKSFCYEALISKGEQNHFHPDYRKPGEVWSIPNMGLQRLTFMRAKNEYSKVGRRIINASRATALDVFPKVDFDSLFGDTKTP
jgi:hypothetical protein